MSSNIYEFYPEIYPLRVWIMITNNADDIEINFEDEKKRLINREHLARQNAITMFAIKKSSKVRGVLIVFCNIDRMNIKTIAHESFHAADYFTDQLGLDLEREQSNEHIAYLIGWIADCCEQVKREILKN